MKADTTALPWIEVAPGAPYFLDETGAPWHPIGQNDSIAWPDLAPLYRRKDVEAVERHLRWLKAHGVTCLRLMLECAHSQHRYFERPAGRFVPAMVQLWGDLFALCEKIGLRILLTPLDTFWMWIRWRHHPWNRQHGGPLEHMSRALLCGDTRLAVKERLDFAIRRWGGSGALFAWDLWNEMHPAHAQDSADPFGEVIHDLSTHVRRLERRLYGRTHPQTVSLFGPELRWKPHLSLGEAFFRHPDLDFATIHIYKERSIDNPHNTVSPARAMGEIVRDALAEIRDTRPFLDTEHGPIHSFKDRKITLPEPFDDEYFRHMAWAHLASGGAGGGMRWPNRHPHVLTHGMRRAQRAMADFLPLLDWTSFRRRNLSAEAKTPGFHTFACGDDAQALVWLLRRNSLAEDGRMREDTLPALARLTLPLSARAAKVVEWNTRTGTSIREQVVEVTGGTLRYATAVTTDLALAIKAQ